MHFAALQINLCLINYQDLSWCRRKPTACPFFFWPDGWVVHWCLVLWPSGAKLHWWSVIQATHLPPPPVLYLNLPTSIYQGAHQALAALRTQLLFNIWVTNQYLLEWTMRSKQGYNSSEYGWWRIGVMVDKRGGVLVNRFGGVSVHRLSLWCIGSECAMPSRPSSALLSQGSLPLIRLSDTCTNAHQPPLLYLYTAVLLSC